MTDLGFELGIFIFLTFSAFGFFVLCMGISIGIVGYMERRSRKYFKGWREMFIEADREEEELKKKAKKK
jgi:hypothetical protein